jgi:hypothetical protein
MKMDVFKLTTFILVLASLFFPWLSFTRVHFFSNGEFSYYAVVEYSPALIYTQFNQLYNGNWTTIESSFMQLGSCITFPWGQLPVLYSAFLQGGFYVFSVTFAIIGLIAMTSWESTKKRVFFVSVLMLILGATTYLVGIVLHYNRVWDNGMSIRAQDFNAQSLFPSIGLFLYVLSIISFSASYLHPKFLNLPIKFGANKFDRLKRQWLAIPEKERLPVIFLISLEIPLLPTLFFVLMAIV